MHSPIGTRKWCSTCRRSKPITDQFEDGHYEPYGEQVYLVTLLECGHAETTKPRTIGPAPGAPYAGPAVPVSPTSRPADVARTPIRDPWLTLCEQDA